MSSSASFAVRIERNIIDAIKRIAQQNRRSIKGQVEMILLAAIRENEKS